MGLAAAATGWARQWTAGGVFRDFWVLFSALHVMPFLSSSQMAEVPPLTGFRHVYLRDKRGNIRVAHKRSV